jgi:hypothetical protein
MGPSPPGSPSRRYIGAQIHETVVVPPASRAAPPSRPAATAGAVVLDRRGGACSGGPFAQGGSSSAQLTRTWSKDWRRRPRAGQCELPDQRAPDRERSWTETYAVPKAADVHPAIIVERFISASPSRGHSRIFLADNLAHGVPLEIVERCSSNGVRSEGGVRALGRDDLSLFPLMATALPPLWPAPPGNAKRANDRRAAPGVRRSRKDSTCRSESATMEASVQAKSASARPCEASLLDE